MNHWLVKSEPGAYAWETFVQDGRTAWTGVRNYQARNNLRAMKKGDAVLYYHSGDEKQVVGMARVEKEAYADPTEDEGDWSGVDLSAVRKLKKPVPLETIKGDSVLRGMALVKNTRLSVSPVTPEQFERVLELGE